MFLSAEVVDFLGIITHLLTSDFASLTEKPSSSHDSFLLVFVNGSLAAGRCHSLVLKSQLKVPRICIAGIFAIVQS